MDLGNGDLRVARIDVRQYCRDGAVNQVSAQAIEVLPSWVGIPVKASDSIAIVSYALMEGCPVSARMSYASSPFLLEGLGVLLHP